MVQARADERLIAELELALRDPEQRQRLADFFAILLECCRGSAPTGNRIVAFSRARDSVKAVASLARSLPRVTAKGRRSSLASWATRDVDRAASGVPPARRNANHEPPIASTSTAAAGGVYDALPPSAQGHLLVEALGITQATRIEADYTRTDCQLATFTGRVVLTKG